MSIFYTLARVLMVLSLVLKIVVWRIR